MSNTEDLFAAAKEVAGKVKDTVQAVKEAVQEATETVREVKEAVQQETAKQANIITPKMAKIPEGPLEKKWTNYKDHQKLVNPANKRRLDVIVVGTGLAGASAAATLAEFLHSRLAPSCALHRCTRRYQRGEELPERW